MPRLTAPSTKLCARSMRSGVILHSHTSGAPNTSCSDPLPQHIQSTLHTQLHFYTRAGSKMETYKGARTLTELKEFVTTTKGEAGKAASQDGKVGLFLSFLPLFFSIVLFYLDILERCLSLQLLLQLPNLTRTTLMPKSKLGSPLSSSLLPGERHNDECI